MLENLKFVLPSSAFQTGANQADGEGEALCRNVFCITVFNENLEFLSRTISSLAGSIRYAEQFLASRANEYFVFLVFDGVRHIDINVARWLEVEGFTGAAAHFEGDGYKMYNSVRLVSDLADSQDMGQGCGTDLVICHVAVAIKDNNQGKLNSHKIFFEEYCQSISPTYCYQIDAGTIIQPAALISLLRTMDTKPSVGALAPCVLIPPPEAGGALAEVWQYMDFVMQKAFGWPFEVLTGHLSVVPGQFSVYRWRALRGAAANTQRELELEASPVANYLRGPGDGKPLEAVMYLAEDRVVSTELVLARNSKWKVEYCAESSATTDACVSFRELLRQRRRWVNSTLACRVSLVSRMLDYFGRSDRRMAHKTSFFMALLAQALLAAIDIGAPSSMFASFEVLAKVLFNHYENIELKLSFILSLLLAFSSNIVGRKISNHVLARPVKRFSAIMFVVTNIALISLFCTSLPLLSVSIVYAPLLLSFVLMTRLGGTTGQLSVAKHGAIYALTNIVIAAIISAYSMWNLCDVSWGTKGLCTQEYRIRTKQLIRLRNVVFSVWLIFNLTLIAIAACIPGVTSSTLNPVVEIQCCLSVLMLAFVAFAGIFKPRSTAFSPLIRSA